MNKNFSTMQTNVGNEVQDTTSTMKTIIKTYLNQRYYQFLRAINWNNVRPDYSFSTVASTQNYALPDDFGKELYVLDSTNGKELVRNELDELVRAYPDALTVEGAVARYCIYPDVVKKQPTSASIVTIASSSASDTTQTILVRGDVSGVNTSESVTLTGTTSAVTTSQFTRITGISKSAVTAGYVTLTSNSAAVTLAVLSPKSMESRYKLMKLHYVPDKVITILAPYNIKPTPLVEDYDYPVLDIADILEKGAIADAWRYKRQFSKASVFETLFMSNLTEYIWEQENQPNKVTQFNPQTYDQSNLY